MTQFTDGPQKAALINFLAKKLGPFDIFIETGTSDGHTLRYVIPELFEQMFSIEIHEPAYRNAVERVLPVSPGVLLFLGSSIDVLPEIFSRLLPDHRVLYWLDAHGAEDEEGTPIREELDIIYGRGNVDDVLLIDDARFFGVWHSWPTLEEIEEQALRHGHTYALDNDVIRIAR